VSQVPPRAEYPAESEAGAVRRLLVIRLVPPGAFRRLLDLVRERWPGARVTALIASPEGETEVAEVAEVICSQKLSALALLRRLRGLRPEVVMLAGGADYGLRPTYWKAVVLAWLSGARVRRQWEVGQDPLGQPLSRAVTRAVGRAVPRLRPWHVVPLSGVLSGYRSRRAYHRMPRRGPKLVQIGLTEACNYHCLMCGFHNPAVDDGHKESELPRLSYEMFARLLSDLKQMGAEAVDICGNGEPLTHPQAMDMIGLARSMGFGVSLATNGALLTASRARRLVELGLRRLHVSINAGTSATYPKMHPGTPPEAFETILGRLREMADYADATGRPRIDVEFSAVLTRLNKDEIVEMVKSAHRARASWFMLILMGPVKGQRALLPTPGDWPGIRVQIAEARQLADRLGIGHNLAGLESTATPAGTRSVYEHIPCYIGHEFALILGGGEVMFCCHCVTHSVGDLHKDSFATIWKSKPYQETRKQAMALPATRISLPECGCFLACSHVSANVEVHRKLYGERGLRSRL